MLSFSAHAAYMAVFALMYIIAFELMSSLFKERRVVKRTSVVCNAAAVQLNNTRLGGAFNKGVARAKGKVDDSSAWHVMLFGMVLAVVFALFVTLILRKLLMVTTMWTSE